MSDRPVLLITGASSGIGAATARAVHGAGFRVALAARRLEPLQLLATELGGESHATAVVCDAADWDQVQAAVATTVAAYGRLDAVFANAGFGAVRGLLNETPEHWRDMVLTNLLGPALLMRASIPELEKTRGHVIVTASIAGHTPIVGSLYSATKHGVVAPVETARKALVPRGIRVTAISPGNVDTPFFDNQPQIALTSDDVARAALFALQQPEHVAINEIVMRHRDQEV